MSSLKKKSIIIEITSEMQRTYKNLTRNKFDVHSILIVFYGQIYFTTELGYYEYCVVVF